MPLIAAADAQACEVTLLGNDPHSTARWQGYVAAASGATIYHDLAWREIFGRSLGYRSFYLMAQGRTGAVEGVLPLFRVPSFFGRARLVSVPFRDRGGVIADTPEAFLRLVAEAEKLRHANRWSGIELKSIEPYDDEIVTAAGLRRADHWVHSQTDLSRLNVEDLRQVLGDKTRNMLRQAEQAGLRIEESVDPASVDDWIDVYSQSQRNLGLPGFSGSFFRRILNSLGARGLARLVLVRSPSGEAAAGSIIFVENERLIYGYSASTAAGREARANDLMLAHLLEAACREKKHWLDLGSDSPLQAGLLFFKRKWRAKQSPVPSYFIGDEPPAMDSSMEKFQMARAIVSRTPRIVSRLCLTPLVRYLG